MFMLLFLLLTIDIVYVSEQDKPCLVVHVARLLSCSVYHTKKAAWKGLISTIIDWPDFNKQRQFVLKMQLEQELINQVHGNNACTNVV